MESSRGQRSASGQNARVDETEAGSRPSSSRKPVKSSRKGVAPAETLEKGEENENEQDGECVQLYFLMVGLEGKRSTVCDDSKGLEHRLLLALTFTSCQPGCVCFCGQDPVLHCFCNSEVLK